MTGSGIAILSTTPTITNAIAKLRRMISEPTTTAYEDATLKEYIEGYPVMDSEGADPEDTDWIQTYDLNAAAAEIWDEKAADIQDRYDFTADGGSYHRSQAYEQASKMAAKYRSKSCAKSAIVRKWPKENNVYSE